MRLPYRFVAMLAGLFFLLLTTSIQALPLSNSSSGLYLAANTVSLDQAVKQVKKQTGGRILSAETTQRRSQKVHRIKVLLPNGSVRVMYINAN